MVELNLGTNQLTTLPGDISNLLNLEVNSIIINHSLRQGPTGPSSRSIGLFIIRCQSANVSRQMSGQQMSITRRNDSVVISSLKRAGDDVIAVTLTSI